MRLVLVTSSNTFSIQDGRLVKEHPEKMVQTAIINAAGKVWFSRVKLSF